MRIRTIVTNDGTAKKRRKDLKNLTKKYAQTMEEHC